MKKVITIILCLLSVISPLLLAAPAADAATINSSAGVVTTQTYSLNIRSGMTTTPAIIGSAKKGSYLTLLEKSGEWWKVEYTKGKYGYCHADYITSVSCEPAIVNTQSMNLNVRSGAGLTYTRVGSLTKGEVVLVLSISGDWSKILYQGNRIGYASSQYLSGGISNTVGVALNVPDFKQTDNRWKNVYIGNSGKTIGQIGCATTGIAMMESFRTGTTIYPDAMSKQLKYTSSGSVYWPSHFKVVTSNANLTDNIKSILDSGKPVLIGGRTPGGNQHWVVVTGYTGQYPNAEDFTINDPGSYGVTNLQQFLDKYSIFYKYFYY